MGAAASDHDRRRTDHPPAVPILIVVLRFIRRQGTGHPAPPPSPTHPGATTVEGRHGNDGQYGESMPLRSLRCRVPVHVVDQEDSRSWRQLKARPSPTHGETRPVTGAVPTASKS